MGTKFWTIALIAVLSVAIRSMAEDVIKVDISQIHISAYNSTSAKRTTTTWWFIVDKENHTATVTYPRSEEGGAIDEPFSTPYNFGFVGWQGLYNQAMYNCWSEILSQIAPNATMFYTALKVPSSFTKNGETYRVTAIGEYALKGSNAQYINVPVTIETIEDYAFEGSSLIGLCEASPYQIVPSSVKTLGKGAFKDCANLSRVIIGDGVEAIQPETFDGCPASLEIRFGSGVKSVSGNITAYRVAFASETMPVGSKGVTATEIWIPAEYADKYSEFTDAKLFSIATSDDTVVAYPEQPRRISFTQRSAFYNMNEVFKYIYYYPCVPYEYPAGSGVFYSYDFTTNALIGRGACKVHFTMNFGDISRVYEGNQVYEYYDRANNCCNSYSIVAFKEPGDYTVTYTSTDITRACGTKAVKVIPGVYVKSIAVSGDTIVTVGNTIQLSADSKGPNGETPSVTGVKWISADNSIATVDSVSGIVTGVGEGVTVVRAVTTDPLCSGTSGSIRITVVDAKSRSSKQSRGTDSNLSAALTSGVSVKIEASHGTISICNLPEGEIAEIYTTDGKLFERVRSAGTRFNVSVPSGRIYIVATPGVTTKVRP